MLTVKNVVFVTSLKHDASLLFDRKDLGYRQTQKTRFRQPAKSLLQRLQFA